MDTTSRIVPVELSREQIDNHTVQAQYKAGYSFFIVKSKFASDMSLSDLFYKIILKKHENERHDT